MVVLIMHISRYLYSTYSTTFRNTKISWYHTKFITKNNVFEITVDVDKKTTCQQIGKK